MTDLNPSRGSVSLVSPEPLTLEGITQLARAAKVAGVPAGVRITNIRLEGRYYDNAPRYEVDIAWEVPR